MRLLDVFLLHCLLRESPPDTHEEGEAIARNQERVAARGREPGLRLERGPGKVLLGDWGRELLDQCAPVAGALDEANGGALYRQALASANETLTNPTATPSARVLAAMSERHENSYTRFVLAQSLAHSATLRAAGLTQENAQRFAALAMESLDKQRAMEAADTLPFEAWRQRYLSVDMLRA
jgi:glutamate--cysteine ligase